MSCVYLKQNVTFLKQHLKFKMNWKYIIGKWKIKQLIYNGKFNTTFKNNFLQKLVHILNIYINRCVLIWRVWCSQYFTFWFNRKTLWLEVVIFDFSTYQTFAEEVSSHVLLNESLWSSIPWPGNSPNFFFQIMGQSKKTSHFFRVSLISLIFINFLFWRWFDENLKIFICQLHFMFTNEWKYTLPLHPIYANHDPICFDNAHTFSLSCLFIEDLCPPSLAGNALLLSRFILQVFI